MNNDKIQNSIKKAWKLSENEKSAMRERLLSYADFHARKAAPAKSSGFSSYISNLYIPLRGHAFLAAGFVAIVVAGTGVSYAAEGALPGDILYPIKVAINEPLRGSLALSTTAKAQWESDKFIRRIQEAEMLAESGKLDDASLLEVEKRMDMHFEALSALTPKPSAKTSKKPDAGQANFAPDPTETGDARMMTTMSLQIEDAATTAPRSKAPEGSLEAKINEYKANLQIIKSRKSEKEAEKIEQLERKLEEKAAQEAERRDSAEEAEDDEIKLNKSEESKDDNKANVFDSQKEKVKGKKK